MSPTFERSMGLSCRHVILRAAVGIGLFTVSWLVGCGARDPIVDPPKRERLCTTALPGTFGVLPLSNKAKAPVELAGTDDLLSNSMLNSGCFEVIEREQLRVLIEEMRLCDDQNPDREYFNCGSFAKKGKILGVKTMVLGSLMFFEPDISGTKLALKLPGVGGIDLGKSYTAMAIELRAVDVETAQTQASTVIHAKVESTSSGISAATHGVEIRALYKSSTPFGVSVQKMIQSAVSELRQKLSTRAPG